MMTRLTSSRPADHRTRCTITIAGLACVAAASVASGQPLNGSGPHLPLPPTIQVPHPGVNPTLGNIVHPTSFEGTWSAPAEKGWHGTFFATGPVPNNSNTGTTLYNFTTLAAGHLRAGTYFSIGDVDGGSTEDERFILRAFDGFGVVITSPWLDVPSHAWGTGRGPSGDPTLADMPGWSWDAALGEYEFDGKTVTGFNPTISIAMVSNRRIHSLEVVKTSIFNGFSLAAPVPAPGTLGMLGVGSLVAMRRRR